MSEFSPLIKSHPSARVRRLLASAELDAPPSGSRERALLTLSSAATRAAATTNFSGIALGTTVHRLIGAVTVYGSEASAWRLLLRGSLVGAAAGVMTLATIATLRWQHIDPNSGHVQTASQSLDPPGSDGFGAERAALLESARAELANGDAVRALDRIEQSRLGHRAVQLDPELTLLRVKALLQLGRRPEAEAVAAPLLSAAPSRASVELRALFEAQQRGAPASSK